MNIWLSAIIAHVIFIPLCYVSQKLKDKDTKIIMPYLLGGISMLLFQVLRIGG